MPPLDIHSAFRQRFGSEPDCVAIAPGRINLIGEHTDYNDGFVFPVAIDRATVVAAKVGVHQTRLYSGQKQEGEQFGVDTVQPGDLVGWAKYPAGVAWVLREHDLHPANLLAVVESNIPMGSGVSSSAALELAFLVLQREIVGFKADGPSLAKMGKECENRFVGVNSGIMDQLASAMGKKDQAIFIDTRTLDIEYASIPSELSIVLCDTKKERALTDSAYNERRSQCEKAAEQLGVLALRDANLDQLEENRASMDEKVYLRARHVITENLRAQEFKGALDSSDFSTIGELMKQSHVSLRDDYEVSCFELDQMAEAAWASPGCIGARMTGAGFGGACVALVQEDKVNAFVESALKRYEQATGKRGEALACKAVDGARILK